MSPEVARPLRIVINGAGIAGPALAFWLERAGHEVLLVEEAPALRRGGYIIDFWGIGYDVAERMGLIPRILEHGYRMKEVRFADRRGRVTGGFPVEVFGRLTGGRFTSLRRSDLSAAIFEAVEGSVDTLFGDSIAGIEDRGGEVVVRFDHAAPRTADLVIGADGLHSRVRTLVFGPESKFEVPLGYHVAALEIEGYQPREDLVYVSHGLPGRQVSRLSMRDDRTLFLFIFRDEYLHGTAPGDDAGRQAALKEIFRDFEWEVPRILELLPEADGLYFDRVSQIRMDRWSSGRTVLVGDAAACVSLLAGEGTGLALAEATVLAGELGRARGDHAVAFARYEKLLRPLLQAKQRSAARLASSFVPSTRLGLRYRDLATRLLRFRPVAEYLVGRDLRDDIVLPDYS